MKAQLRRYWERVRLAVRVLRGDFGYMTISTYSGTQTLATISLPEK